MPGRTGPARRAWVGFNQAPKPAYLLAPGFQNVFSGGTNTTVISTGNSGGASGDAFSTVTGSPTFSSTHPLHGPLTAQFALVTSTVTSLTTTKPGTTTEHWVEFYVYFTANPAAVTTLYSAVSTATVAASVKLDTAGRLLVAPTSGTTDYTFTAAIALNAWNRVELHLVNSTGTGTMQTRLYAADSQTVVEDSGVRSTTSTLANTTSHVFGQQAAVAGTTSTWWLGDPEVGTTGFIGPNVGIAAPAQPSRTAPSGPTLRGTFTPTAVAPLTTASFTPTAGALLITTTYGDATAGVPNSAKVTDSLGNRWDQAYLRNFFEDGRNSYLQAWYQVVEASPVARTVTVTDQDGAQVHGGWVEEWTSVDTTVVPFGVEEFRASNTADPLTIVLTTAYPNSQVIGAGVNWDTSAWVAGAATVVNQTSQVSTFAGGATLKASTTTATAGTTVTLTASRAGVVADFHLVAFELLGALAGAGGGSSFMATVTDSSGQTDAAAPLVGPVTTDSAGTTDAVTVAVGYAQTVSDLAGTTDAASPLSAFSATVSDSAGHTDGSTRQNVSLAGGDTAGSTDSTSVSTATTITRTVTDDAGQTDAGTTAAAYSQQLTDSAGQTDAVQVQAAGNTAVPVTDSAGTTDAASAVAAHAAVQTDTAGSTDSVVALRTSLPVQTDSAGQTDTAAPAVAYSRSVDDAAGSGDGLLFARTITVADSAGATDQAVPSSTAFLAVPIGQLTASSAPLAVLAAASVGTELSSTTRPAAALAGSTSSTGGPS